VRIERAGDVLRMTLDNAAAGNAITGVMFDAMLAALTAEAARPAARVLHVRGGGRRVLHGARARRAGLRRRSARRSRG